MFSTQWLPRTRQNQQHQHRSFHLLAASWLLLIFANLNGSLAWKPIAGSSSAITDGSFSLKQSHPGEAATSYAEFGASSAESDEDNLLLARAAIVNAGSDSGITTAAAAAAAALPDALPISFHDDAAANHYDSYTSLEEEQKSAAVGFTHTPLYGSDRCSVKKFAFNQDGVVTYQNEVPEMEQFTMCLWMRFTNHTGDHVLLTYQAEKEPREIQIWVANSQNSSFLSMAIKGQQMYRLNYPLRMRQWHHMCTSWNGKTGEWQIWLKAERIGRGFHNSLVGHKIPANGKLRSGGGSPTGEVSHGLHFEITLIQVYRVALSAGKAHRDHKHHHVHIFDHAGQELASTTRPPPPINRPQPMHALLASGQIPTRVRINLANPGQDGAQLQAQQPQPQQQAITVNTDFVNGQINAGSRLVAQQLLGLSAGKRLQQPRRPLAVDQLSQLGQFHMLNNAANAQFIDETETHIQFKREANAKQTAKQTRKDEKKLQKRGLVLLDDGSVVDDGLDGSDSYDGLAEFGGQQFKQELTQKMNLEEEISAHDREAAEEEVKAVMAMCNSCSSEPFQGAIVFAWKDVIEHMNNVLKGLSVGDCGNF